MKKILLILLFSVTACSTNKDLVGKMLTENIPSQDKAIKEGTPLNSTRTVTRAAGDFNLIERLYDTVWFQTEKDYDDGKLEVETEFVIFDDKSWIVEREMENGRMERVEADDFAKLTWITDIPTKEEEAAIDGKTVSRNAAIARNESIDDGELEMEYEGYWLEDENTLYIVEGDTSEQAERLLKAVIANPTAAEYLDTEKYTLSTTL
jgi:hypothetical protein